MAFLLALYFTTVVEGKKEKGRGFGGLIFMLAVMALYGVVFLLNEQLGRDALDHAGKLLSRLAPVLVLVFALIFVSNLLIPTALVRLWDHRIVV